MTVHLGRDIQLPTAFGPVRVRHFAVGPQEGLLVCPLGEFATPLPVRIHSSCLFSEALLSTDCDCAAQLHESIRLVVDEGGIVVYQYQEGRGAGLAMKIEAIGLEHDSDCDTAAAYKKLGLVPDPRDHVAAAEVVKAVVGVERPLVLLTNNPGKMDAFTRFGLNVVGRRPLVLRTTRVISEYLDQKGKSLGHLLDEAKGLL